MPDAQKLKSEFDRAKRELLQMMLSGDGRSEDDVQDVLIA